jgi:hypothetical protein
MRARATLISLCAAAALPAAAGDLTLAQPIDCVLGDTCFIQQYVDHDPGPGATDFTCGPLTYDGHKGTDFGLPSFAAMRAGVDVLAAAPGKVIGTRDTMPDTGWSDAFEGKDCGNGVAIDHGDGWQTQYCHMKRGSISVRTGEQVDAGSVLGQVGYSGRTQFPHLHISVRKDGQVIDPFDPDGQITCGAPDEVTLWADHPAYTAGGLLNAGFADRVPDYAAIKDGTAHTATLAANSGALVLWGYAFGAREGDVIRLRILAPDGSEFFAHDAQIDATQAQLFRAAGTRLRTPLERGQYSGEVLLYRGGVMIDRIETTLQAGG